MTGSPKLGQSLRLVESAALESYQVTVFPVPLCHLQWIDVGLWLDRARWMKHFQASHPDTANLER